MEFFDLVFGTIGAIVIILFVYTLIEENRNMAFKKEDTKDKKDKKAADKVGNKVADKVADKKATKKDPKKDPKAKEKK